MEYINAKAATSAARSIFDHRPVPTEMFWFLLKLFTKSDLNEKGILIPTLLNILFSANMDSGILSDVSRDVSPLADADNGCQGTLPQHGGHLDVLHD